MVAQFLVNGLVASSGIALVAIGFGLIYSTTRFFHFAHGAVYSIGAYIAYAFISLAGWPPIIAIPGAIVLAAFLGCLMDLLVYRPLRRRGASAVVLLISSIGLYVVFQNLISLCFGDATLRLREGVVREGLNVFGTRITPIQVNMILITILGGTAVWSVLRFTRMGKMVKAVANDPELARIVGIDSDHTVLLVLAVGSALAAMAGIMMGYDTDLNPTMGFRALFLGVVACIVGGIGSIGGGLLGSLLLGVSLHLGVWKFSSRWQDAIAFGILIIFLCIRPHGFLGRPLRKVAV